MLEENCFVFFFCIASLRLILVDSFLWVRVLLVWFRLFCLLVLLFGLFRRLELFLFIVLRWFVCFSFFFLELFSFERSLLFILFCCIFFFKEFVGGFIFWWIFGLMFWDRFGGIWVIRFFICCKLFWFIVIYKSKNEKNYVEVLMCKLIFLSKYI